MHPRTVQQTSTPVYRDSSLLSSTQEKGTAAIIHLACQVPLHITGVHTCGPRTLNPNHHGNSLKMHIELPGFLTHLVRDALEAAFNKLLESQCYSHIWKPLG